MSTTTAVTQTTGMSGDYLAQALLSHNDNFVLKEIIGVISGLCGSDSSTTKILRSALKKVPYIVLIIVVKHYTAHPEKLFEVMKSVTWSLAKSSVYRERKYNRKDIRSPEYYIAGILLKLEEVSVLGMKMYITPTEELVTVKYIPFVHSSHLRAVEEEGEAEFLMKDGESKYYIYSNSGYRGHTPSSQLFPSKNYTTLEDMVRKHILVEKVTRSHRVLGILIDGIPGLGKSKSAEYIATKGNVEAVHRADLSQPHHLNTKPKDVFKHIFTDIIISSKSTLFMIDEMDKYLDFYIKTSYTTMKNAQPTTKNGEKIPPPPTPPLEEYTQTVKLEFLLSLLQLLERDDIRNSCVVVFCCNNFDTIFEGIDMTHLNSVLDRFLRVRFEICDKSEIIRYYKYHNDLFGEDEITRDMFYDPDINSKLSKLHDSTKITFRQLGMLTTKMCYNYEKIVSILNNEYTHAGVTQAESPSEYLLHKIQENASSVKETANFENTTPEEGTSSPGSVVSTKKIEELTEEDFQNEVEASSSEVTVTCPMCGEDSTNYTKVKTKTYTEDGIESISENEICRWCLDKVCMVCCDVRDDDGHGWYRYNKNTTNHFNGDVEYVYGICETCITPVLENSEKYPGKITTTLDWSCEECGDYTDISFEPTLEKIKIRKCRECNLYRGDGLGWACACEECDFGVTNGDIYEYRKVYLCEECARKYPDAKLFQNYEQLKMKVNDSEKHKNTDSVEKLEEEKDDTTEYTPEDVGEEYDGEIRESPKNNVFLYNCKACNRMSFDPKHLVCGCSECQNVVVDTTGQILSSRDSDVVMKILTSQCHWCLNGNKNKIRPHKPEHLDDDTKENIIVIIKGLLNKVDITRSREGKSDIAAEIFHTLNTPEGIIFTKNHPKFCETVIGKVKEFIQTAPDFIAKEKNVMDVFLNME